MTPNGIDFSVIFFSSLATACLQAMFSRPMPQLACQLNAWVTALTCQWLMGPCKINDLELADGTTRPKQGVLVERQACCCYCCLYCCCYGCTAVCCFQHVDAVGCAETDCAEIDCVDRCRYLEEAGCASICINSCKVPTQVGACNSRDAVHRFTRLLAQWGVKAD